MLKITIIIAALAVVVVATRFLIRAWAASNLFDRQYRFPIVATALRLGATKSGGLMGIIDFRGHPK